MSVAELLDHGQAHPWANLRLNNVTVDGTETSIWPINPALPIESQSITYTGLPVRTTAPGAVIVFTYPIPVPAATNFSIVFLFGINVKGGPAGVTNNAAFREICQVFQRTGGVITSSAVTVSTSFTTVGFAAASILQTIATVGPNFVFGVENTAAGQTADWTWYVKVLQMDTTL